MRIKKIEPLLLEIPISTPMKLSPSLFNKTYRTLSEVFVKVRTYEGVDGWGEAFPHAAPRTVIQYIEDVLRPLLEGSEIDGAKELSTKLWRHQHHMWGGISSCASSGVEIAIWDVEAKLLGKPLRSILNSSSRSDVPAYLSLPKFGDPQKVSKACGDALEEGYDWVKVHEIDLDCVKAARATLGSGVKLGVDASCFFDLKNALRYARGLERYEVEWLEEPLFPHDDYALLSSLRQKTSVPIAAGENEFSLSGYKTMMKEEAVDIVQPDITKCGGIGALMNISRLVGEKKVAAHQWRTRLGLIASIHVVASIRNGLCVEYPSSQMSENIFSETIVPQNGKIQIPSREGLGVEPREEAIRRFRAS
ncbi:MAG: mandelate racemase/muconate lactonizing enzyme family protein [Thaumarchaeota archaeon]|nr:mandelate racemase/muconate lactonizing enzyme family protein [Nitrososphaerota archaeon]